MGALGQASARSQGRALAVTSCLYCGKSLSLLQRWLGADRHFCSIPHRDLYKQEQTRLAIKALEWNGRVRAQPMPSPLAKKAKPVLVSKPNPSVANNFRYERVAISRPRPVALTSQRGVLEQPCPFSRSRSHAGGSGAIAPLLGFEFPDACLAVAEPIPLAKTCTSILPFSIHNAIVPVIFRQQLAIFPQLNFEQIRGELVPASSPAFAAALEMTRETGGSKPRKPWPVSPLATLSIQPLGVDDPDESNAIRQRTKALASVPPMVVGDALKCRFMPAAQANQCLGLRAIRQPEQGLFVPGLRIGTLRPRVAFGPKPVTYAGREDTPAATQKNATPPAARPTIVASRGSVR